MKQSEGWTVQTWQITCCYFSVFLGDWLWGLQGVHADVPGERAPRRVLSAPLHDVQQQGTQTQSVIVWQAQSVWWVYRGSLYKHGMLVLCCCCYSAASLSLFLALAASPQWLVVLDFKDELLYFLRCVRAALFLLMCLFLCHQIITDLLPSSAPWHTM